MNTPQISIPTSHTDSHPKPHTVYDISIRLPLRSFSVRKRYSDFAQLHADLTSSVGASPDARLPPKTYFKSTVSDAAFAEQRRRDLELYIHSIQENANSSWRESPPWRQFLNLPSSTSVFDSSSSTANMFSHLSSQGSGSLADPVLWLDAHRETKSYLQEARFEISRRDQTVSTSEQHDASANAKKNLVKASGLLESLERGLASLVSDRTKYGLGDGELRRRKDLVASGFKERDVLETLANSTILRKPSNTTAGPEDIVVTNEALRTATGAVHQGRASGRILGGPLPETEYTRQLDNTGVLQLQKDIIQSQDQDLETLLKAVGRQKAMGLEIGQELDEQNKLLDELGVDVERVDSKLHVVKKRMKKIH